MKETPLWQIWIMKVLIFYFLKVYRWPFLRIDSLTPGYTCVWLFIRPILCSFGPRSEEPKVQNVLCPVVTRCYTVRSQRGPHGYVWLSSEHHLTLRNVERHEHFEEQGKIAKTGTISSLQKYPWNACSPKWHWYFFFFIILFTCLSLVSR